MRVLGGLGLALLVAAASAPVSASLTWTVGAGADCDAHTIQDAVNLAAQSQTTEAKFIEIASDQDYSAQSIHVADQSLGFVGGPLFCDSLFTGDPTVISGDGASGPVFSITGASSIDFYHLEIRDGTANDGGGIDFVGNGSLALTDVLLDFNNATNGGAISASTSGGTIDIFLNEETLILRNTAQASGGGIALAGETYLYAVKNDTLIGYNRAVSGYGGGIFALTPGQVTIGSPGYHGLPVLFDNNAVNGGGIAMISGGGDDNGNVRLFTTDASTPVSISGNIASSYGGAIYLRSEQDLAAQTAQLCAQDVDFNDNAAVQGTALALDTGSGSIVDSGSFADINPDGSCDNEGLGAVHCSVTGTCNQMSRNIAQDSNGQPTDGATVLIGTSSTLNLRRMEMHGNTGGYFILAIGDNDSGFGLFPRTRLLNCLTGANAFNHELIRIEGDDNDIGITQCTFAPDIINSTHVIHFDNSGGNSLVLAESVVDEPGTLTLSSPGIALTARDILAYDASTLPSAPDIVQGEPAYVDLANGNYRLAPTSPGVDFSAAGGGTDIDGHPRDVDLPQTPNFLGPRDLGAYETQRTFACSVADTIYCNGFEN